MQGLSLDQNIQKQFSFWRWKFFSNIKDIKSNFDPLEMIKIILMRLKWWLWYQMKICDFKFVILNEIKWNVWVWTCDIKWNDWMSSEICDTMKNEIKSNEICEFKVPKIISK